MKTTLPIKTQQTMFSYIFYNRIIDLKHLNGYIIPKLLFSVHLLTLGAFMTFSASIHHQLLILDQIARTAVSAGHPRVALLSPAIPRESQGISSKPGDIVLTTCHWS